ncbi:hypothetical protein ACJEBK_19800 [Peribacillus frigoritolerans]|uniref:hypothetical protein n=1 Tax=Peribacillus frigoritolerans TaxID=450367 RepID=UPI0038725C85
MKNVQEVNEMLVKINELMAGRLIVERPASGELRMGFDGTESEAYVIVEQFEQMKQTLLSLDETQQQAVIQAVADYYDNSPKDNIGLQVKILLTEEEDEIWSDLGPKISEYMKRNNKNGGRLK